MISITHDDWYTIKGRGPIYICSAQENPNVNFDRLSGKIVEIDGKIHWVTSVEYPGSSKQLVGVVAHETRVPVAGKRRVAVTRDIADRIRLEAPDGDFKKVSNIVGFAVTEPTIFYVRDERRPGIETVLYEYLDSLEEDDRVEFFTERYCRFCGGTDLPCHCMNDE